MNLIDGGFLSGFQEFNISLNTILGAILFNVLKIAITGGIGSGKTHVCKIFESLGIPVYYADKEAKRLMNFDKSLKSSIKDLLGRSSYHNNGRLDRNYVASRIFDDKKLLKKMNALVHPAVSSDFIVWANKQKSPYVLEESAIVFEAGLEKNFDAIILVLADKELRIRRVMKRDGLDRSQVMNRIKNQDGNKIKKERADFIILNNEQDNLKDQVKEIHLKLTRLKK